MRLHDEDAPVGNCKVQPSIIVVIEPAGAKSGIGRRGAQEPERGARVGEESRPLVAVKVRALPDQVGLHQIVVAVVVEIARRHAHSRLRLAVHIESHTRFQRRFGECGIPPVPPQIAGGAVIRDINVGPAVSIEIGGHHA